jgi:thiol-disulfide isomerase/thioredoxin
MKRIYYIFIMLIVVLQLLRLNNSYDGFTTNEKTLIICKADWCGHCKAAASDFKKLEAESPLILKDGSKVDVKILDDAKDKAEIAQYGIDGYPTVLLKTPGRIDKYPGKRTYSDIIEYLNTA